MSTVTAFRESPSAANGHKIQYSDKQEWIDQVACDEALTNSDARVGVVLSRFINSRSGRAMLSYDTLCEKAPVSVATAKRAIQALLAAGYLSIEPGRGRGHANVYMLAIKGVPLGGQGDFEAEEKGIAGDTNTPEKRLTHDTFSDQKGIKNEAKRYQNAPLKGVTSDTPTKYIKPKINTKRAPAREDDHQRQFVPRNSRTFVTTDDPRWPDLAALYLKRKGQPIKAMPRGIRHGWTFSAEFLKACEPKEGTSRASSPCSAAPGTTCPAELPEGFEDDGGFGSFRT